VTDGNEEAIGLDAKFVIKDALVLDVMANPDFSQIESDEPQVTVNQRFEVFFPERRPFFLENNDVFQTPTNLVFTRRIIDPSAGVKLTGKQGPYAIGALLANDESPIDSRGNLLQGETAGVGVLRLSRDISEQSRVGFLITDRELADGHNRVGALDGRIKLNDNWVAQFQLAAADTQETGTQNEQLDGVSYNVFVDRQGTHLSNHTHYLYTSRGFRTELGFLGEQQRPDSQNFHHRTAYRFRPPDSKLTSWGPSLLLRRILDTDGNRLDWSVSPEIEWNWAGGMGLELGYDHTQERLLRDDFPSLVEESKDFSQYRWSVDFDTKSYSTIDFGVGIDWGTTINFVPFAGEPELEDFLSIGASMLWRPVSPLQVNLSYLRTELNDHDGPGRIFTNRIGRVRVNWQFTRELSLRLIGQVEETDAAPGATSLTDDERLTADLLLRYLWNPWWALYVGYNTSSRDFQQFDDQSLLLPDASRDSQQIFLKFSYLFQL
jgi:hypothetical protein